MATGERLRKNAYGRYYVTDECNGCGLCYPFAMLNFAGSDDGTYYYVVEQPRDEEEDQAFHEAMEACPMACIRDDGEAA